MCLVMRATSDGYVVGRALVEASDVEWLSPTHVRPYTETRPTDVNIPAMRQGNIGGQVELKPARFAKGVPIATQVGVEVVFGEALDAAALRAKRELKSQFDALVKTRKTWWRHLCERSKRDGWAQWRAVRHGQACDCGATETRKASAA